MKRWEAKILNSVAWLIGMRGGSVGYCWIDRIEDADIEMTINDITKNNEENEANKLEKESGE
jgi:hypothetical protein